MACDFKQARKNEVKEKGNNPPEPQKSRDREDRMEKAAKEGKPFKGRRRRRVSQQGR